MKGLNPRTGCLKQQQAEHHYVSAVDMYTDRSTWLSLRSGISYIKAMCPCHLVSLHLSPHIPLIPLQRRMLHIALVSACATLRLLLAAAVAASWCSRDEAFDVSVRLGLAQRSSVSPLSLQNNRIYYHIWTQGYARCSLLHLARASPGSIRSASLTLRSHPTKISMRPKPRETGSLATERHCRRRTYSMRCLKEES